MEGGRQRRIASHQRHVVSNPARSSTGSPAAVRGIVAAMTTFPLALDGIRVLDLSRVIAGPWCGALLGDFGADVIKVEDTDAGDESRTWPPKKDGETAAYLLFNRNKRGMTLDLKSPEGVEVIKALCRSGRARRELSHRHDGELRPRLRRARRDQPAPHLLLGLGLRPHRAAQGQPGLRSADAGVQRHHVHHGRAGRPARPRRRCRSSTSPPASSARSASRRAVHQRERTGLGQRVDGSLLDTAVALLAYHAEGYLLTGAVRRRSARGIRRSRPIATSCAGTGSGSSSPPPMTGSGGSSPRPSASRRWPPTRAS